MTIPSHRSWGALTSEEVPAFVERDPVVVLPLAATEQHGPHLPLSTDMDIGEGLILEALARLEPSVPVRVLPRFAVGASTEHAAHAGTLTLAPGQLSEAVEAVGASVARTGVRRLVLMNSHGGNRAAMDRAALALRRSERMLVVKASYPRFPRPDTVALPDSEWRHGLHGGAIETAMMLYLRPDIVRDDHIKSWSDEGSMGVELEGQLEHIGPEGTAAFGWLAGDLHPTGVSGDPRLADAEMGERLVHHYGGILAGIIREARAFPVERLR